MLQISFPEFSCPKLDTRLTLDKEGQQQVEVSFSQEQQGHSVFPGCTAYVVFEVPLLNGFRCADQPLQFKTRIVRANGVEVPQHVMEAHEYISRDVVMELYLLVPGIADHYLSESREALKHLGRSIKGAAGKPVRESRAAITATHKAEMSK